MFLKIHESQNRIKYNVSVTVKYKYHSGIISFDNFECTNLENIERYKPVDATHLYGIIQLWNLRHRQHGQQLIWKV